jgi:cytochrome d ubiquinol oxidase subunit I
MVNDTGQIRVIKNEYFQDKKFLNENFRYFGYASLMKPEDAVPNVALSFYSFHLMVILGFFFILLFIVSVFLVMKGSIAKHRWFLWIALLSIPLAYIASEAGWVLAEAGRQPWIIQDLMPVTRAVSQISASSVMTTFILFAILFTALLIAEVSIMLRQINTGPKHSEDKL